MNRKKLYYFRTGTRIARRVCFKNIVLLLKYMIFLVANLISQAIVILQPVFEFGHNRLIDDVIDNHDFKFEKIFDDVNSSKKYWTSLMVYLIKMGILIAGAGVIYTITKATYQLGIAIDRVTIIDYDIVRYIFLVPGVIIGLWFIAVMYIKFSPSSHLIKDNEMISIGEVLQQNFNLMNKRATKSMMNIIIINILKIAIWSFLGWLLIQFTDREFDVIILSMVKVIVWYILIRVAVEKLMAIKISSNFFIEDLIKSHGYSVNNDEEIRHHDQQLIALFENLPHQSNEENNDKGEE